MNDFICMLPNSIQTEILPVIVFLIHYNDTCTLKMENKKHQILIMNIVEKRSQRH